MSATSSVGKWLSRPCLGYQTYVSIAEPKALRHSQPSGFDCTWIHGWRLSHQQRYIRWTHTAANHRTPWTICEGLSWRQKVCIWQVHNFQRRQCTAFFSSSIQRFHLLCRLESHSHIKAKLFYKRSHTFSSTSRMWTSKEIVRCHHCQNLGIRKRLLQLQSLRYAASLQKYPSNG